MRTLIAVLGLSLLAACQLTLAPLPDGGQGCGHASSWSGSSCYNSYSATVISIGPTLQYANNADVMCYQFSPAVVSVKVGANYAFQNNTGSPITIMGANQVAWVTVDAGSTSTTLNFSASGVFVFAVQGCRGMGGTPWYGVVNVTVN